MLSSTTPGWAGREDKTGIWLGAHPSQEVLSVQGKDKPDGFTGL